VEVDGAVVVVVLGQFVGAAVVVVVVPLVVVLGSHGTVVVVVVLDVVGVVVVVVGGGAVVGGAVVGGPVVVVVPPGPAGRVVGVVGAGGDAEPVVVGGLPGWPVVRVPAVPGTGAPAARPPRSGASVETCGPVDDSPAPEPRMLAQASSWEVIDRSQFTSRETSPPLNHLRARTKSPQRSVSSRTLARNPTAMLTAAMSNRSAA
jgi:hypothetical protein